MLGRKTYLTINLPHSIWDEETQESLIKILVIMSIPGLWSVLTLSVMWLGVITSDKEVFMTAELQNNPGSAFCKECRELKKCDNKSHLKIIFHQEDLKGGNQLQTTRLLFREIP